MPDLHGLLLFIAAGWLLNLSPGPDVLYIVTNALRSGVKAGFVAGLGIATGCCVHIMAAAVGVGALLAASATAFTVLKWIGAAYLLWIGAKMLFSKAPKQDDGLTAALATTEARPLKAVFLGGFWTNVLNPKVAIFFLAFVPQFIAPGEPNKALAFVALGLLFSLNSLPVALGYSVAAAWLAKRGAVRRGMHVLDRVAGVLFIGFGLKLALSDNPAAR